MTHKLIKVSMVFIMIFGLLFSVGNSIYASETAFMRLKQQQDKLLS